MIFTAATLGILVSSLAAEGLAKKYSQETLVASGFGVTAAGIALLLGLGKAASSSAWAIARGLLLIGLGLGVMLTPSVNLVQPTFPEAKQGEIPGLSRSISNLGSSLRHAIAGTILVSDLTSGNGTYVAVMIVLAAVGLAGLGIAVLLPSTRSQRPTPIAHVRLPGEAGGVPSVASPALGGTWASGRAAQLLRASSS